MQNQTSEVVLIVDDNPTNLSVLMDCLTEAGFETLVAQDGEGAISQAEFALPDLILLDIMMPGIDGYETCNRLKANSLTADIPIIFVSALSELSNKVKGFKSGAVDYITKPFQQEEVIARVTTHLTIQRQKKELYKLNATKDKFFSIISHDMRGIFSSMLGSSDILVRLSEKDDNAKYNKFSTNIQNSLIQAHKLMENLLQWAKIQKEGVEFKPEQIDFYLIAEEIVRLLSENARNKEINLFHEIKPDTQIFADLNMTKTIVRNLCANALKFTHAQGEIKILGEIKDRLLEVAVCDTGVGIDEADLKKLFQIDQKFKKEGTAGEKGTGLGLILCKDFVEKHEGKIWVKSEPGKGTEFRFTLPLIEN